MFLETNICMQYVWLSQCNVNTHTDLIFILNNSPNSFSLSTCWMDGNFLGFFSISFAFNTLQWQWGWWLQNGYIHFDIDNDDGNVLLKKRQNFHPSTLQFGRKYLYLIFLYFNSFFILYFVWFFSPSHFIIFLILRCFVGSSQHRSVSFCLGNFIS